MGVRSLPLMACLAICLGTWHASPAAAQDGNAVASSVRDAKTGKPLDGVAVEVAQNRSVTDRTRGPDGTYVLKVPVSIKTFDIVYSKAGYRATWDLMVKNNRSQQKRPIARMFPLPLITKLTAKDLGALVEEDRKAISRARELNGAAGKLLLLSAQKNLKEARSYLRTREEPEFKELKSKVGRYIEEGTKLQGKLEDR